MASTLDITSGGRLELGIGAGWNEEECTDFGIELGTMRERFDRFEEGLAVLEGLFTQERTTFEGQHYRLHGAMNNPKPLQARLPICIGGNGRTRTIPLAARYADHWNYAASDPAEFADLRDLLHQRCADIDRDPSAITCSFILRYTGDDAQLLADRDSFEAVGADLGIVSIPKNASPSVVDHLAAVLTDP
jgi:alkanesulfonate monooxygenase SsuD/methylene tetrahydromethanopterin reductase-like flavin-dependent oxidoreductase (luciferase family)